jgi:ATP-dependent DNA helicase RecQ
MRRPKSLYQRYFKLRLIRNQARLFFQISIYYILMKTQTIEQLQDQLLRTLRETFGLQDFREGQLQSITTLLTEGRLLCILPTGYGKSLLYQLPACLLNGVTIVISPLLALMRDQMQHLNQRFNIPTGAINSDQSDEENYFVRQAALQGHIKILFVAPEQLDNVDRFNFLLNLNVELVVVDEAHCISTWGHDFRPSYRQILHFLHAVQAKYGNIKMLALTATANERVEADISKQIFLSGQEAVVFRQAMDRPNIRLSVLKTKGAAAKLAACEDLLQQLEGCGLIYCATRDNTELVADYLKYKGLNVSSYHAGYEMDKKRQLQEEFVKDKYKALAATNALGMGIDKGNLRFIIHFDFPGSITAYYQEVGRCGRDGQKAEGIMLYDPADQNIHEYFIDSALPSPQDFQKVIESVANAESPPGITTIKMSTGLHPTRVTIVIAELIEQEYLSKYSLDGKQVYRVLSKQGQPDLSRYAAQEKVKSYELKRMKHYGQQSKECRMVILRSSLGDKEAKNCRHCDSCLEQSSEMSFPAERIIPIVNWLNKRPLTIAPSAREKVSAGISILDSKIRSQVFVNFMKQRASCPEDSLGMENELLELLTTHANALAKKHRIAGIVPLPSRTWQARNKAAEFLAKELGVSVMDLLTWKEMPLKRQGELLNNNQRHDNVHQRMTVHRQFVPSGALILLDDYIGSGNTIREAARALRSQGVSNELVPLTIASVKWHLGKQGFVQ